MQYEIRPYKFSRPVCSVKTMVLWRDRSANLQKMMHFAGLPSLPALPLSCCHRGPIQKQTLLCYLLFPSLLYCYFVFYCFTIFLYYTSLCYYTIILHYTSLLYKELCKVSILKTSETRYLSSYFWHLFLNQLSLSLLHTIKHIHELLKTFSHSNYFSHYFEGAKIILSMQLSSHLTLTASPWLLPGRNFPWTWICSGGSQSAHQAYRCPCQRLW